MLPTDTWKIKRDELNLVNISQVSIKVTDKGFGLFTNSNTKLMKNAVIPYFGQIIGKNDPVGRFAFVLSFGKLNVTNSASA